jgi:hypothetical protein
MPAPVFVKTSYDNDILHLAQACDKRTLAYWAHACVVRVLPLCDDSVDTRIVAAVALLARWLVAPVHLNEIRAAALASHAAARNILPTNRPAGLVARAAGQAVSTAHARMHAATAAWYAASACVDPSSERMWQYGALQEFADQRRRQ